MTDKSGERVSDALTEDASDDLDTQLEEGSGEKQMGFIGHLLELRDRVMRSVLVIIVIFIVIIAADMQNDIYHLLSMPLTSSMIEGDSMIATGVITVFLTPIKLAFILSIFAAFPYLVYQAWGFIAPGLYKHEKKLAVPLIVSSAILFYAGIAFAYLVVMPNVFTFMRAIGIDGVNYAPDITLYLDFSLKMFFAFGIAFEVPIATILLVLSGITTAQSLAEKRPYIIVGAFIFGMLLTPPDPLSQAMLAIPVWLLFEVGLLFSRVIKKKDSDEEGWQAMSDDDMESELDRIESEDDDSVK